MMLGVMYILENDLGASDMDVGRKRDVIVARAALVILYGGALRGGEILLLEASELLKRCNDGKYHITLPYVISPLMGHFKNETGERNVSVESTGSGKKLRPAVSSS